MTKKILLKRRERIPRDPLMKAIYDVGRRHGRFGGRRPSVNNEALLPAPIPEIDRHPVSPELLLMDAPA